MERFLLSTRALADLIHRIDEHPVTRFMDQWEDDPENERVFVSAISIGLIEAEINSNRTSAIRKVVLAKSLRQCIQDFSARKLIVDVTFDIIKEWAVLLNFDLMVLADYDLRDLSSLDVAAQDESGKHIVERVEAGADVLLMIATATRHEYILVDRWEPCYERLLTYGLRRHDPYALQMEGLDERRTRVS